MPGWAILDLAGDVTGRRILDIGCGAGPLLESLRDRGAIVTGTDRSTTMLELARQRLGDTATLLPADITKPLPFPDGAFDDAIAALVLHYLEDWTAPLAELRRVLRPGGRLPHRRHQRTSCGTGRLRTLPGRDGAISLRGLPELPVLRPGSGLADRRSQSIGKVVPMPMPVIHSGTGS